MSDQRRTIVPEIVTSSLFVTCMWQLWATGIILIGLGGSVTLQPFFPLHGVIDRSVSRPLTLIIVILTSDTPARGVSRLNIDCSLCILSWNMCRILIDVCL